MLNGLREKYTPNMLEQMILEEAKKLPFDYIKMDMNITELLKNILVQALHIQYPEYVEQVVNKLKEFFRNNL